MLISIITVSYNSAATIADTLRSVAAQDYPHVEHIIIDGKSTDHTATVVSEFGHVSAFVSEKDEGLYDAMNKGIKMARGEIIGILNSDDMYCDASVLRKVVDTFNQSGAACVYGDLQYVHASDTAKVMRTWKAGKYNTVSFLYGWMPPHPTFFVKREVYDSVGLFNTTLKSAADYEMMLRILYKYHYPAAYLPNILVKMRAGGVSNASLRNRFRANREDAKAWKMINKRPHFFTLYLKPIRKIPQFLIR